MKKRNTKRSQWIKFGIAIGFLFTLPWYLRFQVKFLQLLEQNQTTDVNNDEKIVASEPSNSKTTETSIENLVDKSETDIDSSSVGTHTASSTATVMGLASGYDLRVYKSFVGSLRNTGYDGHIILGLSEENLSAESKLYLLSMGVTMKFLNFIECTSTTPNKLPTEKDIFDGKNCIAPYDHIKITWARFVLQRDWLVQCETCTGPVLLTDVRDTYFQSNPFAEPEKIEGLQVFEEYKITTQYWLAEWPIRECKGESFEKPMLCSGTTIGTRQAIIDYVDIMYKEMTEWINQIQCRFNTIGDDQSIHNYVFYANKLPFAKAIPFRTGIVNTVGSIGGEIFEDLRARGEENYHFPGKNGNDWLGKVDFLSFRLTNSEGLFLNEDGSISPIIHQYDRFGPILSTWLAKQPFMEDAVWIKG